MPPTRAQLVRDLFAAGYTKTAISKEIKMSLSDVYRVLPARHVKPTESITAPHARPRRKPRAMTVERFAKELGIPAENVRKAISDGKIRSIAIGKTVLNSA